MPPCLCWVLYHRKNSRQKSFASSMQPNRPGKPGWYLMVLKCTSEYGLSFETLGRPTDYWVTPGRPGAAPLHLAVMGAPRSELQREHPGLHYRA